MGARTKARKRAIDVLFEADQRGSDATSVLQERIGEPGTEAPLPPYSREIVLGVAAHASEIDALIEEKSSWPLSRMPAVDRAIVRVALWEIQYNDEVPNGVAVDEAVELATKLSTDDSPAFVNGLLGAVIGPRS